MPESIDNIVYCLVSSMRKKIEPELKQCRYIKTVRGVGYKFEGKKDGHLSRIVDLKTEEIFKTSVFLLLFYAILRTEVVKVTSQKVCFLMGDVIGYFFISKKVYKKVFEICQNILRLFGNV